MQAWQATVQDDNGNVVVNPSITVYQADGVTLAQIYNENETPKANPFIGTLEGFVQFFAPDGDYRIRGSKGANQTEFWSVTLDATAAAAIAARNQASASASAAAASAGNALTQANRAKDEADRATAAADAILDLIDFSGRFDTLVGRMLQGETARILCYGDSTTDGNGTTDWTANPTDGDGNAIGSAPHTPPNAWPVIAQAAVRSMFRNSSISFFNAGYSGKQLQEGWAVLNFDAARAPYATPDAVVISFGINDVRQAYFSLSNFETQLLALCVDISDIGAFPIFLLPDEPSDELHNGWLLGKVRAVYKSVAERIGVKIIDWGTAMNDLSAMSDGNDWRWGADQPDDTHGNDALHSVKGGFIAASIYPHTYFAKGKVANIAPWSRYCKPVDGYTVFQGTINSVGAAMVVPGGTYALDEFVLDMWVWSVGAARNMYWAAVDGNGYWHPRTQGNAPRIGMYDYVSRTTSLMVAPTSGGAVQPNGGRDAEALGLTFRVPQGLSRWAFRAPRDNNTSDIFLGYFSIREVSSVFSMAAPVFTSTATARVIDLDPSSDQLLGCGFHAGRTTDTALAVDLEPGMGVSLWSCRVYGGSATRESNRKRGIFLFRHETDNRLFLYSAIFSADETIGTFTSLGSSSALTWDGTRKMRVSAGVDGGGQFIRVYDGWNTNSAIITATNALSSVPLPWGGTPGAIWQRPGVTGVAGLTIYGQI